MRSAVYHAHGGEVEEKLFRAAATIYRAIFARPSCYRLNKLLFDLSVRGLGLLNAENDRVSGEEYFRKKILACHEKPVVLDIGANLGHYAAEIVRICPDAVLYAFEPHPATFRSLQQRAAKDGFHAFNIGMGAEVGTLQLYDRQADGCGTEHASLYREVIEEIHRVPAAAVEVAVSTVDAFVAAHGIDRITLLKVDTEGHEYQVLRGAEQTLAKGKIDLIQIEFNEMNTISRTFFRDFHTVLGSGYDCYRLLPGGLLPLPRYRPLQCELFAFQNLLFVRRGSDCRRES